MRRRRASKSAALITHESNMLAIGRKLRRSGARAGRMAVQVDAVQNNPAALRNYRLVMRGMGYGTQTR